MGDKETNASGIIIVDTLTLQSLCCHHMILSLVAVVLEESSVSSV